MSTEKPLRLSRESSSGCPTGMSAMSGFRASRQVEAVLVYLAIGTARHDAVGAVAAAGAAV